MDHKAIEKSRSIRWQLLHHACLRSKWRKEASEYSCEIRKYAEGVHSGMLKHFKHRWYRERFLARELGFVNRIR